MSGINIGTNDPSVTFSIPDVDLTGSTLSLALTWPGGSKLVTTDDDLSISVSGGDSTVTWARSVEDTQAFAAPLQYDLFRTISGNTSKLAAGRIALAGTGQIVGGSSVTVEVPGIQGPPGDDGAPGPSIAAIPQATTQTAGFTFSVSTQLMRMIPVNVASQVDVTLPNPTTLNVGEGASVLQVGAGKVRFIDHLGAALTGANVYGYAITAGAKAVATFIVEPNSSGTNSWVLTGDLGG